MSYILFSPIGSHDPMSRDRDGSMLHICRKYRPEVIVLYLSSEIIVHHRHDDRYRESILLLAQQEGFSPEIRVEERPELENVQVFDFFFQEFRQILIKLHSEFPKHRILLNVSSGTPGMKSSLYVLTEFLPFPVYPVQVSTPQKAHNNLIEAEYYTELYWEDNKDNQEHPDRCQEVGYTNLNLQLQKESISAHLDSWDYAAALRQAEPIRGMLSERAYSLLEAAKARVELNWRSVPAKLKEELGLSGSNGERIDLSEYLLWLQMKQKRGDLADFLRGLTPGLFGLLRVAAEERAGYRLSDYCDEYDRFCLDKLTGDEKGREILEIIDRNGTYIKDRKTILASENYIRILQSKCDGQKWWLALSELRETEKNVRNLAAHTITRVDEKWLEEKDISSREILQMIHYAVNALNTVAGSESELIKINWKSYDAMNAKIKRALAEL